eukprot:CAMPEP_0202720676 /NCGR_PEP_ID=MMETSP1385-20130828/142254_1 /ASSEMBLY_ACC=CAM_ASM_000861 /TAXON_ID=933848 /ORGANISM="Elphidium margaritaceum" /LENGTH=168 /DNA_ID=CAMNT_0049384521 /DNA_START=111 /DNA_END=617 /DNA_ORIENTATION=-
MGAYFTKKNFTIHDEIYEVAVWDTAGEEKFHSLTKIYTRGAHCAIIMYDITVHETWQTVNVWMEELDTEECHIIIVGNKLDIVDTNASKRQISFNEVQQFAKERGCLCMEGSALSGKNVNEMFESVIRKYVESQQHNSSRTNNHQTSPKKTVRLEKNKDVSPKKKLCC